MVGVHTKSVTHPMAFCNIAYISWIEWCGRMVTPFTDINFIPTFNVAGAENAEGLIDDDGDDSFGSFEVATDDANML